MVSDRCSCSLAPLRAATGNKSSVRTGPWSPVSRRVRRDAYACTHNHPRPRARCCCCRWGRKQHMPVSSTADQQAEAQHLQGQHHHSCDSEEERQERGQARPLGRRGAHALHVHIRRLGSHRTKKRGGESESEQCHDSRLTPLRLCWPPHHDCVTCDTDSGPGRWQIRQWAAALARLD